MKAIIFWTLNVNVTSFASQTGDQDILGYIRTGEISLRKNYATQGKGPTPWKFPSSGLCVQPKRYTLTQTASDPISAVWPNALGFLYLFPKFASAVHVPLNQSFTSIFWLDSSNFSLHIHEPNFLLSAMDYHTDISQTLAAVQYHLTHSEPI